MQKYSCPICHLEMKPSDKPYKNDFNCKASDDHIYIHRIKDDQISKIKIVFSDNDNRLFMKVNYDEGFTEVWTKSNNDYRTVIQSVFTPDFSDIERLKSKIKTYLTFS